MLSISLIIVTPRLPILEEHDESDQESDIRALIDQSIRNTIAGFDRNNVDRGAGGGNHNAGDRYNNADRGGGADRAAAADRSVFLPRSSLGANRWYTLSHIETQQCSLACSVISAAASEFHISVLLS